jgi:SAM-dependent methyltransferase
MAVPDLSDRARLLSDTRRAHDAVADDYHRIVGGAGAVSADERGVITSFVDRLRRDRAGLVADVGCGTGRLLPHLAPAGAVVGVDLSPGMLAVARREQPATPLLVGALHRLPLATGAVTGAVAWYSTMYAPDDELAEGLAELRRIVGPGGHLLLGFHVGDETRHLQHAYGHAVELSSRRRDPGAVAAACAAAGWHEVDRRVRPPQGDEVDPQASLVLRR